MLTTKYGNMFSGQPAFPFFCNFAPSFSFSLAVVCLFVCLFGVKYKVLYYSTHSIQQFPTLSFFNFIPVHSCIVYGGSCRMQQNRIKMRITPTTTTTTTREALYKTWYAVHKSSQVKKI